MTTPPPDRSPGNAPGAGGDRPQLAREGKGAQTSVAGRKAPAGIRRPPAATQRRAGRIGEPGGDRAAAVHAYHEQGIPAAPRVRPGPTGRPATGSAGSAGSAAGTAAALTVGDFSRATGLSVKSLRHYHQVGLLIPVQVNRDSGYRYYAPDQIPAAQVIRRLRDLDMPVTAVRAVLTASEPMVRNALITAHLDRLEAELARTRATVGSLRDLLQRPATAPLVEHRTVPATRAVGIRQTLTMEDALPWWQGALGELNATVRAQGLTRTGPSGGLSSIGLCRDGQGEATVYIPVAGTTRPIGRVVPLFVPAAELAIVPHRGSPAGVGALFDELDSYALRHGIPVDGPLRTYHLRDPEPSPDPDQWEIEIGRPVFRADNPTTGRASA
ncbi:MerR family transcriptional regulator [Streptomyces jumonjinensis]|uniref:MerR family transcriptional regulator n=1 Tax=Streptomyces jumonjinensis TaxID=1945 RepID=UPI0037B41D40